MAATKKKLSRKAKTAIIIVSVLAALIIAGIITVNLLIHHYYNLLGHETVDLSNTNYVSDPPRPDETEDPEDTVATEYGDEDPTVPTQPASDPAAQSSEVPTDPSDSEVPTSTGVVTEVPTQVVTTDGGYTYEFTTDPSVIPADPEFMNILVIGTDAIGNTLNGRSDAIIVVSINPAKKRIVLTSIVRDTYVHIPYNNSQNQYPNGVYDKINASHSLGGTALLIKTIRENFGIEIDRFVRAKYADFLKVFECVGGLDISLSKKEIEYINHSLQQDINLLNLYKELEKEGFPITKSSLIPVSLAGTKVHLNSDALFIYSRARKIVYDKNDPDCAGTEITKSADWGRTERQRLVISRTFEKVKKNPTMIFSLLEQCLPLITTDLTLDECMDFAKNAVSYFTYDITTYNLPFNNSKYFEYRKVKNGVVLPAGSKEGSSIVYIKPENKDAMMKTWNSLIYD